MSIRCLIALSILTTMPNLTMGATQCPSKCPGRDDTERVQYALDHADRVYFDRTYRVRSVTIHRIGQQVDFRGHALVAVDPAVEACLVIRGRELTLRDVNISAQYGPRVAVRWHSVDHSRPAQYNKVFGLHIAHAKIGLLYGALKEPVDAPQSENAVTGLTFRGVHTCIHANQPNGFLFIGGSVLDCNPYEWTQQRPGEFNDETARALVLECGQLSIANSEILKTFTQQGCMVEVGRQGTLKLSNCHFETPTSAFLLRGRLWATNLSGCVTGDSLPVLDIPPPPANHPAEDPGPLASLVNLELHRDLRVSRYSGMAVVRSAAKGKARVMLQNAVIEGWRPDRLHSGAAEVSVGQVWMRFLDDEEQLNEQFLHLPTPAR